MKIIHLSDLHLGKRIYEYSMIPEQEHILSEILKTVKDEKPEAVIIAGDVYDKSVPPAEAVCLFDNFLYDLSQLGTKILIISGNHDSAERIAFGSRLMPSAGVYFSPVYGGEIPPVTLNDEYGDVNFYLLPFLKPVHIRSLFPDEPCDTYNDAVRTAVSHIEIDPKARNVLITHQFVTGAVSCESEEISVGGTDYVDADIFSKFDYTALGHLHSPQNVTENVRYCGTPLKYSFSEAKQEKSVTVLELREKGNRSIRTIPLIPNHDMREIRGSYSELTAKSNYDGDKTDDFLHITLTDETDIPDAARKLRVIYPNLMKLDYDNTRTRSGILLSAPDAAEKKTPEELFSEFYEMQNGSPVSGKQSELIRKLLDEATT